ncbi:MAG: hypothetical protein JKY56_00215 [Kofleriaceae bacterium]|nr:hypothetical protein [Kofleriaceae bacterium]
MNCTKTIALSGLLLLFAACAGTQVKVQPAVPVPSDEVAPSSLATSPPAEQDSLAHDSDSDTDSKEKRIALEEMRIEVVVDKEGREQTIVRDARGYLDSGNESLGDGDYEAALVAYAHLIKDFSESSLVGPALYNSGLAHEGLEEIDAAVEEYKALASRNPSARNGVDAQIRIAALSLSMRGGQRRFLPWTLCSPLQT